MSDTTVKLLPLESSDSWSKPPGSLHMGQAEVYYVDAKNPPASQEEFYRANMCQWELPPTKIHILIKTFIQTDEEAGGCGENRRVMLDFMEGDSYLHNGTRGVYENVGSCTNSPREYAVRTILIRNQSDIIDARGDWDYDVLMKKFPYSQVRWFSVEQQWEDEDA
jgi:hypothetical protein